MRTPPRRRALRLAAVTLLPVALCASALVWAWRGLARRAESAEERPEGLVRYFGRGRARQLADALRQTGSAPQEAASVASAVSRRLGPGGGSFVVVASTGGAFHHVTAFRGRRRVVVGRGSRGVRTLEASSALRRAEGAVKTSLAQAFRAAGVPGEVQQELLDAFRWQVDFSADVQEGDRFAAVWSERVAGGEVIGRRLEGALYEGLLTGRHAGLRLDDAFYDRKGRSLERAFLRAPVRCKAISSDFGGFRASPLGWPMRRHRGTDYSAPTGTPIVCVAAGTIAYAGRQKDYGNLVRVEHAGGLETLYGHLSRFGPGIRAGRPARQGQILGYVGATGNATGPHLHFELRRAGKTEDFRSALLPDPPPRGVARPWAFRDRWAEVFAGTKF